MQPYNFLLFFLSYKEPNSETDTKCGEKRNCRFKPTSYHIKYIYSLLLSKRTNFLILVYLCEIEFFHKCLHVSCSVRVSNELGAGNARAARLAVCVAVVLVVTQGILVGTVMILLRNIWGYAYTSKVEVVKQIAVMLPIIAAGNLIDALQSVLAG